MSPRTLPRALPHLFSLRTVAGAALLLAAGSSLLMAQAPSTPPAPLPFTLRGLADTRPTLA
ncbi:MAG: hypothetical protein ACK6DP_14315, partial [Gemmatimonas sp.]